MNLVEIIELLQHPEVKGDKTMVTLYTRMFYKLCEDINQLLEKTEFPRMTATELVKNSTRPELLELIPEPLYYVVFGSQGTTLHVRQNNGKKWIGTLTEATEEVRAQNEGFKTTYKYNVILANDY